MLAIGDFNDLKVSRISTIGVYLETEKAEILMPSKYVPEGTKPGDVLRAFVYKDSEDRLIATTLQPLAKVDDFAALRVKQMSDHGAFMEWGLEKDLLVPFKEQQVPMKEGEVHVVRVCLDPRTERLIGVSKLNAFFSRDIEELHEGQEVDLIIYTITAIGYGVIVNNRYQGLLYHNEVFQELKIGEQVRGFVKKRREDGKVDVSLYKQGVGGILDAKEVVFQKLKEHNGVLGFSDNSTPEEISSFFNMSKKAFKKAIGGLYKEGKIEIGENEIKLKRRK